MEISNKILKPWEPQNERMSKKFLVVFVSLLWRSRKTMRCDGGKILWLERLRCFVCSRRRRNKLYFVGYQQFLAKANRLRILWVHGLIIRNGNRGTIEKLWCWRWRTCDRISRRCGAINFLHYLVGVFSSDVAFEMSWLTFPVQAKFWHWCGLA